VICICDLICDLPITAEYYQVDIKCYRTMCDLICDVINYGLWSFAVGEN